jgi:hypothetical protein
MARARSFLVAGSLVALTLSAYGIGVTTAPMPASAQANCPVDALLYEQVSQLQTRALLLENQWQQRSTVIAPFRVVENNGAELAWIGRGNGGLAEMRIGGEGVTLGYNNGRPYVTVSDGSRQAGIALGEHNSAVFATADGTNGFWAESSPQSLQLASIYSGGSEVANFGVMQGRRAAVRFLEGPRMLAGLGIGAQGAGQLLTLNPGGTNAVTLGGDGSDGGYVTVFKNDTEAVSMNTRTGSGALAVFNNAGVAVGFLAARAGVGGIVGVNNAQGSEVFHATSNGNAGSACVRTQNGNETCLVPTLPLTLTPQ